MGALPTGVPVIGIVSCATGDGTFGWSNIAALHLMKKIVLFFVLNCARCRVGFGYYLQTHVGVGTNGSVVAPLGECKPMVEQLGTHGSKHAGLGTNSETHGVPAGIFGKPWYRNTFFPPSLRTPLPPHVPSPVWSDGHPSAHDVALLRTSHPGPSRSGQASVWQGNGSSVPMGPASKATQ